MRLQYLILAVIWSKGHDVVANSAVDPVGVITTFPNIGTILPRKSDAFAENEFPLELPHRDIGPDDDKVLNDPQYVPGGYYDSADRPISVTDLWERSRKLSFDSSTIGTFNPLFCNNNLASASCNTKVSANLPSGNNPLLVRCGECYTWDMNVSEYTFAGGMNIKGKLQFPLNKKVTIRTPYVIVQGELDIKVNHDIITPANEGVSFIITGTDDVMFKATNDPNTGACSQQTGGECNLGPKPFFVAGGRLNIAAFPSSSCETHTPILKTLTKTPNKNPDEFPKYEEFPNTCPQSGATLIRETFDDSVGNWTGWYGANVHIEEKALKVTNRGDLEQGPTIDISPLKPQMCLEAGRDYLFSVRIKLDRADGSKVGEPSYCKTGNPDNDSWWYNCPRLTIRAGRPDASNKFDTLLHMGDKHGPNYGEWTDWTGVIKFKEEHLWQNTTWTVLQIDRPEAGTDITIDNFKIALPGMSSYPNPNDVCSELVMNGDADDNGFSPYPWQPLHSESKIDVLKDENNNKYLALYQRRDSYTSLEQRLDPNCFDTGVVYDISARVRLHSEFDESYYWYLRYTLPTNKSYHRTLLQCPPQKYANGFVSCSGKFTIDQELAEATDLQFRMTINGDRDKNFDIDFDDMSIQFSRGYINKLVVSIYDAMCWGEDAEIHVGTSSYYSWNRGEVPNGFTSGIFNVKDNNDGTMEFRLKDPPHIPVISAEDSTIMAAQVALVSRNVKIAGDGDEVVDYKGAYLQVLHTPNQEQLLSGVQFDNMGRRGDVDRFPIQVLYSGSLQGTDISHNSIRGSHQRCIVLDGTGNVTITSNVAVDNNGNCIDIGPNAADNKIRRNYVSGTRDIPWDKDIPGARDSHASGFQQFSGPNDYSRNIAVGNEGDGFYFYNNYRLIIEDGTVVDETYQRGINMGTFSKNEAIGNGHVGMRFHYHEQQDRITFDQLKAVNNREQGFYIYRSRRATLSHSFFAGNGFGVEMRWCDEMKISDTVVRGVSKELKALVDPPYYNNPCESRNFLTPMGYRMHTTIYDFDKKFSDGTVSTNRGVSLSNVQFFDFDHDDSCVDSIPIVFNTKDKRDGHWNYISSFNDVQFESENMIDALQANDGGVPDVVIIDVDGSSDPANRASGASAFVSDKPHLKAFATKCTSYPLNLAYCEGSCLRTVSLSIDQTGTQFYHALITRLDDGADAYGVDFYDYDDDDDAHQLQYEGNERVFSIPLPMGKYKIEFFDGEDLVWPKHVFEKWDGKPECSAHASGTDLTIVEPPIETSKCDNLVVNEDMSKGTKFWYHRNDDDDTSQNALVALPQGGRGGTAAIANVNRTRFYDGIGQNIDTRCFHQNENQYYEINVWFRLENNTIPFICDRWESRNELLRCPEVTIKNFVYSDPLTKEGLVTDYDHIGYTVMPNNSPDFNLIHGVVKINEKYSQVQRAWIFAEYAHRSLDYILSDFSFTKIDLACKGNFIRNGDLEQGNSAFWGSYSAGKFNVIDVGSTKAIEFKEKTSDSHGLRQYLYVDPDCFKEHDRFTMRAKFRLVNSQGTTIECDMASTSGENQCGAVRINTFSPLGNRYATVSYAIAIADAEKTGWGQYAGIYTLSEKEMDFTSIYLLLSYTDKDTTVIYDDISMEPLPRNCDDMVLNNSFEVGDTSYWTISDRRIIHNVVDEGVNNDGEYALRYERGDSDRWDYIYQDLDTRCFEEGQQFEIKALFQILDSSGTPTTCTKANKSTSDPTHCPLMYIYGTNCADGSVDVELWNNDETDWDVTIYNEFTFTFPVTDNLATCENVRVGIGRGALQNQAILVASVSFGPLRTFAPTKSPTFQPTEAKTSGPTLSPVVLTDAPTTSLARTCPSVGSPSTQLNAGSVLVGLSAQDTVCTVTMVTMDGNTIVKSIPLARSYNGNDWEVAAGDVGPATFKNGFLCYSQGCQINLPNFPALNPNVQYILTSHSHSLNRKDEMARFLETATFGATSSEVAALKSAAQSRGNFNAIVEWFTAQSDKSVVSLTSHRKYWRERISPRIPIATKFGSPDHPCDQSSRWRRFTFVRNDVLWWMPKELRIEGAGPYILYLDGVLRTAVENFWLTKNETYSFNPSTTYRVCRSPDERVGRMWIELEDGKCVQVENPAVSLAGIENKATYVVALNENNLEEIDVDLTQGEEFMLKTALSNSICNDIPTVPEFGDNVVFGKVSDGTWLMFDPRLEVGKNTISSPLIDGGKKKEVASGGASYCSNVPRNFLNEDKCQLSTNACRTTSSSSAVEVVLDNTTISDLNHLVTGRFVYTLKGLNVVDQADDSQFPTKLKHPCTPELRSRWLLEENCNPSELYSGTNASLQELLGKSGDKNPYIRDIYFPEVGMSCNATDTNPEIEIEVKGQCWKRVHGDFMSVYDMTYWVDKHIGGAEKITKWSQNNGTTLIFPNVHPTNKYLSHSMDRWENNKQKFTFVGRVGDFLKIQDLPNELRTENVTRYFDPPDENDSGVLVCGSYGEVDNANKQNGFVFDTSGDDFSTAVYDPGEDKRNVWYMLSLTANDQLRQRVAWALSQILVVVTSAVNDGSRNTEWFLSYYDLFVRNAFGNYRDILREMAHSPLMAENLSFLQSRSSAYIWERYKIKTQADENFAREIMQLFTMGINKLNMDGTLVLNDQGETMLAYTNEDIESFARAWTGFDLQPRRSNIEGRDNRLDPMKIQAIWRDRFPKTDSAGGYIGDRFQKCQDLPLKAFLKQGATYRFLGNSPLPELMSDPSEFATVETTKRIVLAQSSTLRSFLCNADANGNCDFQNTVTLPSSINYCGDGPECDLGLIRVVQVANNAYYEYVQEPCVNHAFYPDAKIISQRYSWDPQMCANPALPDAAEACCETFKNRADRNSRFDGERMIFDSAKERCTDISKDLCDNLDRVNGQRHETSMYFWTPDKCDILVKVKKDGAISIVHQTVDSGNVVSHVDESNENFFRVLWKKKNAWPKANQNNCGDCKVVSGDQCLCNAFVREQQVFSDSVPPASVEDALSSLSIGAPNPNIFAASSFTLVTDPNTGITTYLKNGNINKNTVFELTDDKGRHFFLKNCRETVYVNGLTGQYTGFYFRNPPHFMNLVPAETALRDAQYETEATLDHYFYHDNTAPFLTSRLIQRITTSNPSPRYVLTAATAFKEGRYTADNGNVFGDGKYGDLKALFAAIYLDREARSVVLDSDPSQGSLREPIIKLLSVLRSMEFKSNSPVLRLGSLVTKIGQTAHSFESVFSFFLPEFKPYGRVGDASLTAPEATLLDMPRIVGILNGLQSLVKHGLCNRDGGFGTNSCSGKTYLPSPSGVLEYGKNDPNFTGETFEGLSLIGGLDNTWVGRDYSLFTEYGEVVEDPTSQTNHVYHPLYNSAGRFFSPSVSNAGNTVVKFQYYATVDNAGGCIGYTTDYDRLLSQEWVYCDASGSYAENEMTAINAWVTCQFVIPNAVPDFRIVVGDKVRSGDSYFDNITTGTGTETKCTGVDIGTLDTRGEIGFSEKVVNELATLLTAGRLSPEHREIIRGAYDKALNADDGLKIAQQLILTTAEFHTTNFVKSEDKIRPNVSFPPPSNKPYRAVVYMMFSGGCDSFNMLTPYKCTQGKDLYQEYNDVRQQVALTLQDLLPVQASDQVCETFGVHADLGAVHQLYNDEDLLFFANTGVLSRPVTKENYNVLTQTQLFAHNHMQREAKRVDPYDTNSGTGVLGRMADVLTKNGNNVGSFSVDRYSIALVGEPGISDAPMIVNRNGVPDTYLDDTSEYMSNLHKETTADSGYFGETWSASLIESLSTNEVLSAELKNVEVGTTFPDSYLSRQLETVARLIATREARGVDTDTFYVETGGFDTHSNVEENLSARFIGVNEGIEAFAAELKRLRVWNNVTTIQTSDFARTLNPNGGDGTDHAWGGNYMMFGGSVKGGQILGEYPDNLTDEGPLTLGRGRMIPSTPWDAVFKGIAGWLGVPNSKMSDVLPNLQNFESFSFTTDDMFGDVLPQPPTRAPTQSPKTPAPTDSPTKAPVPTASPTKKTEAPTKATSKPSKSPSTPNGPTASPTTYPTGAEFCFDDDTLALEGDATKNCAWVRKNPTKLEQRCFKYDSITKKYAFEHCRETCGRCSCDNKNWIFKGVPSKNCDWVGAKPGKRCDKPGAKKNCKGACGQPCCKDDPEYLMSNNEKRTCGWLGFNAEVRCPKLNVNNYMCPESCGKCMSGF